MFEKEAKDNKPPYAYCSINTDCELWNDGFQKGAEFGYNKANEEAMLKLKDEGIVKPLKDSIFRNERLSSQEQQELCAWIECAMDFGENLDECAKELEEAKKANEWHYPSKGEYPKNNSYVLVLLKDETTQVDYYFSKIGWNLSLKADVIAWQEIVLP